MFDVCQFGARRPAYDEFDLDDSEGVAKRAVCEIQAQKAALQARGELS
jgi:hypothetical protein